MLEEVLQKIKEFDNIIIHRHIRPDGDCIGSQLGLKNFILDNFPNKKVYAVGCELPEYLRFLGKMDEVDDDIYKKSLVIIVDTSSPDRISDERWRKGKYIIKIDHHDNTDDFGDIKYVDNNSPSCASILTSMIKSWNDEFIISQKTANLFITGIITDTGRFRFRGVNDTVFNNAAFLVNNKADLQDIYEKLYVDEAATLKLQGYVLNHFKLTKNGVAYIHFTKKMMKHFNVTIEEAGNLVNSLSTLKGSLIWVAFIDQMLKKDKTSSLPKEKEIRVRLRSRRVAINDVAAKYRGGGHLQASGATIYSKAEIRSILKDLDELLGKYKEDNPDAF